jgi:hypothetical protein
MTGKTHFKTLVDSDWLGQWDLGDREFTLEIASVERFEPEKKKRKRDHRTGQMVEEKAKRIAIGFRGAKKMWLAGPVSQGVIKGLYGPYVEDWIGKRLTLYVDHSVKMGSEVTGGIRVKPTVPRGPVSKEEPSAPIDREKQEQINRAREQAEAEAALGEKRSREPGEDDE